MSNILKPISNFDIPNLNFDVTKLDDSIADRTSWAPLSIGGSNTVTHILKQTCPEHIAFIPAPSFITTSAIMLCISIGMIGVPTYQMIQHHRFSISMVQLIGLFFACTTGFLIFKYFPPFHFDRHENALWKGYKSPKQVNVKEQLKQYTPLTQVHALQLIRERCETNSSSSSNDKEIPYFSYELNLVLKDATRLNVTDHGKLSQIRSDAKKLSEFIGKPLWDAAG